MPYSIVTKDNIEVNNIPDDIDPQSDVLKERVRQVREARDKQSEAISSVEPEGLPAEIKTEQVKAEMEQENALSPEQRQAEVERLMKKEQDPLRYAAEQSRQGEKPVSGEDLFLTSAALYGMRSAPAQEEAAPEPQKYTVGETTPAADLQSQALQKRSEESRSVTNDALERTREKEQEIAFEDLSKNDEYFNIIAKYAKDRFGEEGEGTLQEGETKEEFVKRFASHMRMLDTGNLLSASSEQEWLNGADPQQVVDAGKAYQLFEATAPFYSSKGQSGIRPYVDIVKSIASDPSTAISLGAGKGVAMGLANTAKSTFARAAPTALLPVIEGGSAALANTLEQKRDIAVADQTAKQMRSLLNEVPLEERSRYEKQIETLEERVKEGVRGSDVAIDATIGATFGVIEPLALLAASRKANLLQTGAGDEVNLTLDGVIEARKVQREMGISEGTAVGVEEIDTATQAMTPLTPNSEAAKAANAPSQARKKAKQARRKAQKDGAKEASNQEGRQLLDEQGQPTAIAEMQVKNSIGKQATLLAEAVWEQMPDLGRVGDETVSAAVIRTLGQVSDNDVPMDVLESAFIKADVDFEEFTTQLMDAGFEENLLKDLGKMYGESVSDAARHLQTLSVISRMQNKAKNLDPKVVKSIEAFYNPSSRSATVDSFVALKDAILRADKNMIVGMTTNAATVMRNAFGVSLNGTYGVASEAIESLVFSLGKSLAEKSSGMPVTGSIGTAARGAAKDSLGLLFYINEPMLTADVTQKALENSPALLGKLLVTAEETKKTDLYKAVQVLNTPAMLLDKFVRQAVFTASLEKQLRRQGLNLYDLIEQGKNIPIQTLRRSVDDALAFTFSKHPTNPVLSGFVKLVEATRPISSLAFPFARFMANSVEWTYTHYNPGRILTGGWDVSRGIGLVKDGKVDEGFGVINKGAEKIGDAAVGLATFLGAYQYRTNNQDLAWNEFKADDGTVGDLKFLFPVNVPFALADFYIKVQEGRSHEFKVRELVDALVGYKSTAGTQNWILDKAAETYSGLTGDETDEVLIEKTEQLVGEVFGQFFGRAFVPLNQVSDVIGAFDRDETIPRDAYVYTEGEEKGFTTAAKKQIQKIIPFWKQALPEYQPATREIAPFRDSGVLKQLTGFSIAPHKNRIEKEIQRLNLGYSDVYRTTGDRTIDSQARKVMASILPFTVDPVLEMDVYQTADRQAQALMLKNSLREAQKISKEFAINKSIVDALNRNEVPQVTKQRYAKLDPRTRALVNKRYREMTGTSLSESTDPLRYHQAVELAKALKKAPIVVQEEEEKKFAVGGAAAKGLKSLLGKTAKKAVGSKELDLLGEMESFATKKADDVVETPDVPVTPTQAEAAPPVGAVAETNKLMSTPSPAPVGGMKIGEFDVDPTKWADAETDAFADEGDILLEVKELHPKQYENMVWSTYMQKENPNNWSWGDRPHKDVGDMWDFADEDGNLEFGAKEMKKQQLEFTAPESSVIDEAPTKTPFAPEKEPVVVNEKILTGDLKRIAAPSKPLARIKLLDQLKQVRRDSFDKAMKTGDFYENDSIVLGVSQGEFRSKYGREFDPQNAEDMTLFKNEVNAQQKRLDSLRTKYKDTPDVELFHGSRNAEELKEGGLKDPATLGTYFSQTELNLGGTSFTTDPNLNFRYARFGGTNPKNFISTKMPYAEYEFSRVNMPMQAYNNQDIDVVAKAISGDPNSTRPLGLPRASMYEKEDFFVEPEKLRVIKNPELEQKIEMFKAANDKRIELQEKLKTFESLDSFDTRTANDAYRTIRDYMKAVGELPKATSTKAGVGQQYEKNVEHIPMSLSMMSNLSKFFRDKGLTEKADLISEVRRIKRSLVKSMPGDKTNKEIQDALKVTDKLAKGGLASRKRK